MTIVQFLADIFSVILINQSGVVLTMGDMTVGALVVSLAVFIYRSIKK